MMTNDQIVEQIRRLTAAFPSLKSYIAKLPEADREAMQETWKTQLRHRHEQDVATIVGRMIEGEIDLPPNYEFDRTALAVRREAALLESERESHRRTRQSHAALPSGPVSGNHTDKLMHAIRRAMVLGEQCKRGDITEDHNAVELAAVIGNVPAPPDDQQPRYRCVECQDMGRIEAEHTYQRTDRVCNGRPVPGWLVGKVRRVMYACGSCVAGRRFSDPPGDSSMKPLPIYQAAVPQKHKEFEAWA